MLAHELSHVAHRDVLVMTVASFVGIVAGMVTRGAQFGGLGAAAAATTTTAACRSADRAAVVSLVVYAVSFLLIRLLSRYRELSADRVRRLPHPASPSALASALTQDHRRDDADPRARPARRRSRSTRSSSRRRSAGSR